MHYKLRKFKGISKRQQQQAQLPQQLNKLLQIKPASNKLDPAVAANRQTNQGAKPSLIAPLESPKLQRRSTRHPFASS